MLTYCVLWGHGRAFVPAKAHGGIIGHWVNGELFMPDKEALREALPYHWRKAYDRALGFWIDKDSGSGHMALYSLRGAPIATLYINPPYIKES